MRIQASERYPNEALPKGENLCAEQASWACNPLNYTATSANPKLKSPYEMWYGTQPQSPLPFLKPGCHQIERRNKLKPKAVKFWYLGPAPNHPRDAMRMLCKSGRIVATGNVTWAHTPAHVPPTSHQAVLAPNGGEDVQGVGKRARRKRGQRRILRPRDNLRAPRMTTSPAAKRSQKRQSKAGMYITGFWTHYLLSNASVMEKTLLTNITRELAPEMRNSLP